jgi:GDP-4-dehydro-6-deoxy-D-mannose reductase
MKVLVTGVGGFVGSHLAASLAGDGVEVWGTYLGEMPTLEAVRLLEVDILDRTAVAAAGDPAAPDSIVHLAGLSHVGQSWREPAAYFQVNVLGAELVLRAAAGRRVLVASSAEVYGAVPEAEQPLTEDRMLAPTSPYALSKAALERVARPMGAIVVRSFNTIGPGQAPDFALPTFARQLAAIRRGDQPPVLLVGNLAARRDFVAVTDAVAGYRILLEKGEGGEVYNLGRGEAMSIEEALHRLIVVSRVRARIEVDPGRIRPTDIPLLEADATKLRALGWQPEVEIDDALRELWLSVSTPT